MKFTHHATRAGLYMYYENRTQKKCEFKIMFLIRICGKDDFVNGVVYCLLGSQTLSRWRRLATPNLAGVLEQRPGVQFKGQRLTSYFEEEKYSIADYEEDGMYTSIVPLLCEHNF